MLVLWAAVTAFAYLGSILLHELGHVLQARREGMEIHGVTLWALGGVTFCSGGTPTAGREFRVAAAGPGVTAVLAAVLGVVSALVPGGSRAGLVRPGLEVVDIVGQAQIYLLAFNLIPAYPLDGGRILFAALWRLRNNLTAATKTASAVGKGFGAFLLAVGAAGLLAPRLAAALPAVLQSGGLASLVIGYFIFRANRAPAALLPSGSGRQSKRQKGSGLRVSDFMNREFVIAEPKMTVADLLQALRRLQIRPIALIIEDGRPLGMISKSNAEQVPEFERDTRRIAEVMVAKERIKTMQATDPLSVARQALRDGPETAVVLDGDLVVGLVSVSDLAHAMVLEQS